MISEDTKLPKAIDFAKGTNLILKHSRIYVCWAAVGLMIGVYDNAIKYVTSRKQFGHYIAGIDIKIFRISISPRKNCKNNGYCTSSFVLNLENKQISWLR